MYCSATGPDPLAEAERLKARTVNISVIYPPSLVTEFQIRLADWTPLFSLTTPTHPLTVGNGISGSFNTENFCPVYKIKSSQDPFGCEIDPNVREFGLPGAVDMMIQQRGNVDREVILTVDMIITATVSFNFLLIYFIMFY